MAAVDICAVIFRKWRDVSDRTQDMRRSGESAPPAGDG